YAPEDAAQVETQIFKDNSKSVLSTNDSPDVGFGVSLNPYRGCEHGCIYCYARPTHEYLGLSAGLDFETKIFAKPEAPALLRKSLEARSWKPEVIVMSGITDCYQPIERELKLTRQCLEVLAEFRNPGVIITKNALVTRDIDVLTKLAEFNAIQVVISITTLDKELARFMEPRASRPDLRFQAVEQLSKAGIPVSVNMAPIVPGLTDSEIPAILKRAADAGARSAHYTLVRLPYGVKDLFQAWLDEHYPTRKNKVLNHIKDTRGGKLYSAEFGKRMKGEGIYADQIAQMFSHYRKLYGLNKPWLPLSTEHFQRQGEKQMSLF
ncbi:MAG: PA0069 family radical SAM protein, partial [Pseudomonadota bacterium]|nr:PA0069 family radical SAM protein [Pseudomonadota bacterium]